MIKKWIAGILLLLTCFPLLAQNYKISVVVNPMITWMNPGVPNIKSDWAALGFDGGLTVDKFFAEKYAVSYGLTLGSYNSRLFYNGSTNFNVNGKTYRVPGGNSVNYNLQYITVPIGLKFKTIKIGYLTYYVNLGFYIQANIKARATSNDPAETLDNENVSSDINLFNLGYQFGGGIEYSLGGSTALILGVHYMNGLTYVIKSSVDQITSSSLVVILGVLF
jgi:hypothetical protein